MKKALSLLTVICMVLSLLTLGASAAGNRDVPADGYYLIGTHNNWDVANLTEAELFRQSLHDADEMILETTLTQGQELKVVKVENGAITTWYPDGVNNNYVVDTNHAGPAVIYFRNTYHNDWAANGGYIWVAQKAPVSYLDADGVTQTCTNYTTANYAGLNWSGWIVVNEDISLDSRIEALDDVSLILMDGKTIDAHVGVHVSNGIGLTVYGQAENTGTLNAILEEEYWGPYFLSVGRIWWGMAAIGTNGRNAQYNPTGYDLTPGPITINGGTLNLQGWQAPGIGVAETRIDTPDITINGGIVNATVDDLEMAAGIGTGLGDPNFILTGSITINGGEVHTSGVVGLGDVGSGTNKVVINGGIVETTGIGTRDDANYATDITINGGVVTVHRPTTSGPMPGTVLGNDPGRIDQTSHVAINGGQVTVEGVVGGSQCEISLGWTDASDFIQAPGYSGTVTLTKDWAVDNSTETFAAGEVSNNATLANKKLIPPVPEILDPILDEDLSFYTSISIGMEVKTTFTIRQTVLANAASWYLEVSKLGDQGEPIETKRFGEGQEGAVTNVNNVAWRAVYTDITAKEMGVTFAATLHVFDANGQEYYSNTVTNTVKDYIVGELVKTDNENAVRTLCADMLNYGAAAQNYFVYDTDNLVNENLSAAAAAAKNQFETKTQAPATLVNGSNGPNLYGSVSIKNRVVLSITARNLGAEGTVQIQVKKQGSNEVKEILETTKVGSVYSAKFSNVEANEMRDMFEFTALVDGVETGTPLLWSVEGYVRAARLNSDTSAEELALLNALLIYTDSAAAAMS